MANFSRHDTDRSLKRLRWPLGLTWVGLCAERLAEALWPLFTVVMLVLASLMLGLHDLVAIEVVWAGMLAGVAGSLAGLVFALRRFRLPSRTEALERLDTSLPGRPIRALMDDQAIGQSDAASAAVWRAHQARMSDRLDDARAVPAEINLAPRDPYALRYVAVLALAVALLFGSIWRVGSVSEMTPGGGGGVASGPVWEGWIEPPRYTGLPTLYLNDLAGGELDVPLGSLITVRFYGEVGALTLAETVSARVGELPAASDPAQDFVLRQSGRVEIAGPGGRAWDIAVLPDAPPSIQRLGAPDVSALGETTLPFYASDDYGVEAGELRVALNLDAVDRRYGLTIEPEPRGSITVPLPVPLAGDRTSFEDALVEDFSKHPWANLPVTLQLVALDAAEQQGLSDESQIVLPGRRFFDPMAAALIEMRRDILWNRSNTPRAAQILRTAAHRPADVFRSETRGMQVRRLIGRMETLASYDMSDETRDALAEELWALALTIEEGDLADALARLERARERLEEAMRNGASDEEIAELMRELRRATDEYLRQLSQQQQQQADSDQRQQGPQDPNAMQLTQDDIQRMMDRIQELMEQGRMAEAEQALKELQELLENLQMAQRQQGNGQSAGQQAMEDLAETLRQQQGLSDQAFRDLQEQYNPNGQAGESQENEGRNGGQGRGQEHEGQQGQGEGQAGNGQQGQQGQQGQRGQPGAPGSEPGGGLEGQLADRQRALRDELRRQENSLPGRGTPEGDSARDALDRAGRAMENAEDALRNNDYAEAIDNQSQAMDALREGMRSLGEAMAQEQQQNGQQGQGQTDADRRGQNTDPLGRDTSGDGSVGSDRNALQGEDVYRRAQDLLDEIRRRSAEADRSEEELDYLKRLLDRF